MPPAEAALLGGLAMVAGAINAVAGGGTLLTFPALLAVGVPSVVANATNTVALFVGTAGSIFSLRRHLAAVKMWLWRFVPVSILGGWFGGVLLTRTDEGLFDVLVPFLLLFATLIFFAQGLLRRFAGFPEHAPVHPHRRVLWLAMLMQFGVAVYGGYFGAGIGILMLASLGLLGLSDLHQVNALKNVLGGLMNATAASWFIICGLIDWPRAAVMTVGAVIGYFLGAHYSQRVPQRVVRTVIIAIGLSITVAQFWRQFGRG